ncbi:transcription regulator protein BACH1 [Gasterosteus aculeatus]
MSAQGPRVSVFTFQSAVHSDHVLQCLDDQRQQDVLCDVTVVVENRSFRAHCCVLASCSEYFHSRIANVTRPNPIITLPDEVTIGGFEPLLQFAYTSKLPFTKENIHAIHSSAEFLGFHDLESACFDFLIPKYSEGKSATREVRRRVCCLSRDPSASFSPGAESSQPKSLESHSSAPSRENEQTALPSQCPLSQTNSGEKHFCLEDCGPQMTPLSSELTNNVACPMLSLPCADTGKADQASRFCGTDILEIDVCNGSGLSLADCGLPCELSTGDMNLPELIEPAGRDVKQTVETLMAESNCAPGSCPLSASGAGDGRAPLEQSASGLESKTEGEPADSALSHEEEDGERSSVEREVAEHLAKGFWSDLCPPQPQALPLEPTDQNNLAKASDFHWLKQLDLSSNVGDCPFLRDFGTGDDPAPHADSLSQSEKSPYMSSSLNSGDDSDLDTDGDTEANYKRAAEIQLPFPVEQISAVSRSAFQQLLRHHHLTPDQLEFVHHVRRRSKNRAAAQRCRKRKLDSIYQLECEIKRLRNQKERLLHERTDLEHNLAETRQSLCGLCKSVSLQTTGSDQDHLQLLAKVSADSPIHSPPVLGAGEESQVLFQMVSSSACDRSKPPADSAQTAAAATGPQTEEAVPPQSCLSVSLLDVCLDMDNSL